MNQYSSLEEIAPELYLKAVLPFSGTLTEELGRGKPNKAEQGQV